MEYACGNIFVRHFGGGMKAGEVVNGHAHTFDHATLCTVGALKIECQLGDKELVREIRPGDLPLLIKAVQIFLSTVSPSTIRDTFLFL